jgi:5-methylcytosine-specific restriction endonuclease McrA
MNQLSEPTINNEMVFEEVAKSKTYKNDHCNKCEIQKDCEECNYGNRRRMLNLKDKVFDRYQFYLQNKQTLQEIKPENMMNSDEKKLMEESYKKSKVFQRVKKQLLDNIPKERRGMCPFCMISEPTTMDHYFAESKYPEYIIFAPNLVPCCSNCNSKKGKWLFEEKDEFRKRMFIHFYYDVLPTTQFLKAKFYVEDKIPQISFYLDFENETETTEIIKRHFERLDLLKRYRQRSNGILSTECDKVKMILMGNSSVEQCVQLLKIQAQFLEKTFGCNYWETCVYRAMSESEEELIKLV